MFTVKLITLVLMVLVPAAAVSSATKEQQSPDAETLFRSALSLYEQQKYDEALAKSAEAAKVNPNDYRPRALAGFIYAAQRKLKNSSDAFAEALTLQPQARELYVTKAEIDRLRNAYAEALATILKATAMFPNYAEAHALLGDLLQYDKERQAEAINALRTAIKLKPTLQQPYSDLGNILAAEKDEKAAEEVFRQGMAADPKRMAGRFALGRLLVKQGRLAEARQVWAGRTSDEDNELPQFIELLTRAENLKRATDALAATPNDPDALVDMGLAVMDGDHWVIDGRQQRALVYFQKALRLKPDFARAQYGIVKAYIQGVGPKDETKTLERELAKLRKLDPKLATEMDEYRKTYVSGFIGTEVKPDQ